MADLASGEAAVVVSTIVVEVGVDLPNATVMAIEAADRFGLAQLHQLRGRVGRSDRPSVCFLISDTELPEAQKRLRIMERTADGFELAEVDLETRGPGEYFGTRQAGLPDLRVAKLTDHRLINPRPQLGQPHPRRRPQPPRPRTPPPRPTLRQLRRNRRRRRPLTPAPPSPPPYPLSLSVIPALPFPSYPLSLSRHTRPPFPVIPAPSGNLPRAASNTRPSLPHPSTPYSVIPAPLVPSSPRPLFRHTRACRGYLAVNSTNTPRPLHPTTPSPLLPTSTPSFRHTRPLSDIPAPLSVIPAPERESARRHQHQTCVAASNRRAGCKLTLDQHAAPCLTYATRTKIEPNQSGARAMRKPMTNLGGGGGKTLT